MLELEWFFGNEVRIMIEIFIGVVSGIIGGLGMGGGTILILLLSLFFGVEQHVAQSTNIIFFITFISTTSFFVALLILYNLFELF